MALWECADCTTRYAVGAPKCPHCESTMRVNEATQPPEEETDMAKITVHGGPTNAAAEELEASEDASTGADSAPASEVWTNVAGTEDYTHWSQWSASTAGTFGGSGTITANAVTTADTFTIPSGSLVLTVPVAS
jgi:hypothetical protein